MENKMNKVDFDLLQASNEYVILFHETKKPILDYMTVNESSDFLKDKLQQINKLQKEIKIYLGVA
jgi:hypothetical protein